MLGLSYSVMVTQRFLVPHFLVRVRVGQLTIADYQIVSDFIFVFLMQK